MSSSDQTEEGEKKEEVIFYEDKSPSQDLTVKKTRLERIQTLRKEKKQKSLSKLYPDKETKKKEAQKRYKNTNHDADKKKKSSRNIERLEHIQPPPLSANLDLWGPKDHNKIAKKVRNRRGFTRLKVREVHPGQSYNPEKNQFFDAFRELRTIAPPPKPNVKKLKRKKSRKKILGDDVLEGVLASQGVYDNIYDRDDDNHPTEKEVNAGNKKKRKAKKTRKKKKKSVPERYGKRRYSVQKKRVSRSKLEVVEEKGEEGEEDEVEELVRKVDDLISKTETNNEKKRVLKRKREQMEIMSVTDSILGASDLDLSVYHNLKDGKTPTMSGGTDGNQRVFSDLVTKRMEVTQVPSKKRKLYHK